MSKHRTLSLIAAFSLASTASAITWDFTAPDFSDGTLSGQDGFAFIFGTDPIFTVDTSGGGSFTKTAAGGAVRQAFSASDLGATFDNTSSIITYTFDFDTGSSGGGFNNNISFSLGSWRFGTTEDVRLTFRDDRILTYEDSTGFNGGSAVFIENGNNIVSATLNYSTDTYTVTVNGSGYASGSFKAGSEQAARFRIDAGSSATDLVFNSISVEAVPESSSYALIAGFLGLSWVMLRRRPALS